MQNTFMKFSRELIKGSTKSLILAVLLDGELYGYQIVKSIMDKSGNELAFGEGSIYPALHSLEKDGFLTSRWLKQTDNPDRKYYSLTRKGKRVLKANIKEWQEFSAAVNKVFHGVDNFSVT